ncbi:hybrid sensor histidine kinase/response regulator transcription factor [Maribacter polysaccharolyticus]|uniref:hybrid sensor histidine kinase/response regulator transcription factor n=1 Tax=Maribacter polysaccharolyticus TaxID=3020831 RepID=UPI00237FCEA9|nr:two-component regulator propeller domain-containing protein [Maribacter polysaccharolyticus]
MRVMVIHLWAFLFLIFGNAQENRIKSSNQRIESFKSEQGFYQNSVNDIVADSKGYIWIATPNGLVRYDGYNFEYYYHNQEDPESLAENHISKLFSDSKGRLWIGSRKGLSVFLTDKEQFVPIKSSAEKEILIKEDALKRVWVGNGSGLTVYNSNSSLLTQVDVLAEISFEKDFEGNPITDMIFLSHSELLIATKLKIYKVELEAGSFHPETISELKIDFKVDEIKKLIKINNSIWIGTSSGLYHTFNENNHLITVGDYLCTDIDALDKKCEILALYQDREKNLWIGTKQNGVLKYDSKNTAFTSFKFDAKYKNGLTSNRINSFYEDAFGVLWIGTAHGGLNKFDKNQKPFQNYSHNPYDDKSLSSNLITDITEDNEGRVWFSFFQSTICRTQEIFDFKMGTQVHFKRLDEQLGRLKDEWVLRLYQDRKGFWWVSTTKGLYLYDEKRDTLIKVQLEIEGELVDPTFNRVIDQIAPNQILLGGSHIYMLNDPWSKILDYKPVKVEKELVHLGANSQINDYVKDSYGNWWFASVNGVFRVVKKEGTWVVKDHMTSTAREEGLKLSHNRIFTIHENKNKDIWLGSFGGGLMKIKLSEIGEPLEIKKYQRKDGLRDDVIYGILEDDKGLLWMSTDMGICCFDPSNDTFNFYDINDGTSSNNFRQSAYLKTKNGIFLMGGVDGLTIFDPKQITKNVIPPKISISRLRINNQPVVPGKEINNEVILERSISDTDTIILNHENRNLSLEIIVQHSATPNKNKLAYKLEGVNQDWIEIDAGKASATYTNLGAGTFNFIYKGSNGDGIWTEQTGNFTIKVLAPWYLRWWSILILVLSLIAMIYAIFKYLVGFEKLNQKLKFEQLDKERVHEMNQAKLRFFTNISHDFKTPLSLIMGPLEKIEERNINVEDKKYFSIIKNNISRLQRLIDQLISYRKAETGHLELDYSKTTLGNFIYPLIEAFEDYAQRAGINFYYKVQSPNKSIVLDLDNTERILLNLFSNAVKYTELDREVSIEAGVLNTGKSKSFYIEVSNSSKGIPKDKIEKIFDRFYRGVDDYGSWRGTGIGLELCKTLTDLMNGSISVKSEVDNKTVFRVELPCNKKLYTEEKENKGQHRNIVIDWLPTEIQSTQAHTIDNSLPNLLIIDDEKDVRSFLFEAFKNKYRVTLAVDGEDGLEKLKENPPQLIICDVLMPKLNGYEFCKRVKNNTDFCHIPVVLLTAMEDSAKKIKGFELGADDYIIKPFSVKHLEVRVEKLIENKQRIFEHYSRNSFIPKDSLIPSERDKEFLEKINRSIEKNMSNSIFGVEELASDINMSTSHFYRKLKELTGQAPNLYLRNFRLQKAAQLLTENKNLTAADVMFEIGIESKSYYSSAFKKIHGLSPSEFVKKIVD